METADSLKILFGCKHDEDLGKLFHRGAKAVSAWRRNGLPAAIKVRAEEIIIERGITDGRAVTVSEPETAYTSEEKEIINVLKNHPLIKLSILEMAKLPEDQQYEEYKKLKEEAKKGQHRPAPEED